MIEKIYYKINDIKVKRIEYAKYKGIYYNVFINLPKNAIVNKETEIDTFVYCADEWEGKQKPVFKIVEHLPNNICKVLPQREIYFKHYIYDALCKIPTSHRYKIKRVKTENEVIENAKNVMKEKRKAKKKEKNIISPIKKKRKKYKKRKTKK